MGGGCFNLPSLPQAETGLRPTLIEGGFLSITYEFHSTFETLLLLWSIFITFEGFITFVVSPGSQRLKILLHYRNRRYPPVSWATWLVNYLALAGLCIKYMLFDR